LWFIVSSEIKKIIHLFEAVGSLVGLNDLTKPRSNDLTAIFTMYCFFATLQNKYSNNCSYNATEITTTRAIIKPTHTNRLSIKRFIFPHSCSEFIRSVINVKANLEQKPMLFA